MKLWVGRRDAAVAHRFDRIVMGTVLYEVLATPWRTRELDALVRQVRL